ncbi:hypothetical protein SJA_C1-19000 [Sphingobium indicum UT26S]|uniref:Uncharacterized protein n=1 Tax=Sphingobium indicum (strain DSM 16413 / CCM 7287 / MTCC 6362 / UT26 / NBRC 101211 / UT26S) TaxID=452662 RepID=D4Z2A2_SPHIU|nr:hypothetical protein SJA_C1-19000 [Sphingobium indicum UT26S]
MGHHHFKRLSGTLPCAAACYRASSRHCLLASVRQLGAPCLDRSGTAGDRWCAVARISDSLARGPGASRCFGPGFYCLRIVCEGRARRTGADGVRGTSGFGGAYPQLARNRFVSSTRSLIGFSRGPLAIT